MNIKLTTLQQVSQLKTGDIITKFPSMGTSEQLFDETRTKDIAAYEVKAINLSNNMLSLVTSANNPLISPSPNDIGRLFIHADNLVSDKTWWINK